MIVHLAVAVDDFDDVLFFTVFCFPRDVRDVIWVSCLEFSDQPSFILKKHFDRYAVKEKLKRPKDL